MQLHVEAVLAGHAVAFHDLRRLARQLGDLGQLARRRLDPHHGAERIAERARVHLGAVAADHAVGLQPLQPLRHRGRRQAHAAPQLGHRRAGVLLQMPDQLGVDRIDAVRSHSPSIVRRFQTNA